MKVVVTGATSFIGKEYVKQAVKKGWKVIAVIRNENKAQDIKQLENVSIFVSDFSDYKTIPDIIGPVDCLVHFSWNGTRGAERNNETLQKSNYKYTLELIKEYIKVGCKRIITIGSQAEYGNYNEIITEKTICNPNTEYGKYKYKVFENALHLCISDDVEYMEPRIFSIYGPGDYENTLIMSLIGKMKNNIPCDMTMCEQLWDYLYVDDAVNAIIELTYRECANGAYNLGSGDVRKLKSYVEELYTLLGSSSKLNYGAIAYPETGMVSLWPSTEKVRSAINWRCKTTFKEGIEKILLDYDRKLQK